MADELELADPAALEALYDPLRYRLFRALETPRSVPELAREVDLPPNRLYYHVRRLAESGLVRQVDTRARGRHTERVYGWAAARIRFAGDLRLDGGEPLAGIARELEAGLRRASAGEAAGLLSYHVVALTPARARELEERLGALLAEFERQPSEAAGARRYGALGVLSLLEEPHP